MKVKQCEADNVRTFNMLPDTLTKINLVTNLVDKFEVSVVKVEKDILKLKSEKADLKSLEIFQT